MNLIRKGETAEVASCAEEDAALVACRDAQGVSALLWSVYCHQTVIRDFLRERLPALDVFEAAAVGDVTSLDLVLREDALRIFQTSADGWCPLHLAAAFGGTAATALLLDRGAHLHQVSRNPIRCQPLHACIAQGGQIETARLLIEQGADVNAAQAGGYTPLHQAAAAGAREMALLLLDAGADPRKLCDQGKTPGGYASERGHAEVAALLE